jgi:hypothetical protein
MHKRTLYFQALCPLKPISTPQNNCILSERPTQLQHKGTHRSLTPKCHVIVHAATYLGCPERIWMGSMKIVTNADLREHINSPAF